MTLLLKKFRDNTFFAIIGFIAGSIVVLFFNYEIFNYYLCWAGKTIKDINPVLPMWLEMLIGFIVLGACAVGSYMLVRLERKNRKQIEQEEQ